jgi:hypothetical protein
MQTEAQQNLSLEEVFACKPNRVRGVAPLADNLIAGLGDLQEKCKGLQANVFTSLAALLWLISIDLVSARLCVKLLRSLRVKG